MSTNPQACSRRSFLTGTAAAAVGGACAAAALAPQAQADPVAAQVFTGSAQGRSGEVVVDVTVKGDCILGIEVTKSNDTMTISDQAFKRTIDEILRYQTVDVDAVTGATLSSWAIKLGVSDALEQAGVLEAFQGEPTYEYPERTDCTTDVVVVGSGCAGMNAACTLAAAGVSCILVEKQGFLGGGDTMFASSGIAAGGGYTVYKLGIENASAQDYLDSKWGSATSGTLPVDLDSLTNYCLRSGDAVDWYISIGVPFGNSWEKWSNFTNDGSSPGVHIIKRLGEQLDYLGVDYRLDTKLESIVREGEAVTGIVVSCPTGEYTISAKAVLLACGGFGYNEDMLAEYADAAAFCGLPHSGSMAATGDGILAAKAVGADLWNMTAIKANNICHVTDNGSVISLAPIQGICAYVDDEGNRFMSESGSDIHGKAVIELGLPNQRCWAIFDQTSIDEKAVVRGYNELGYFKTGATWAELGADMGLDEAGIANFVAAMEGLQAVGKGNVEPVFEAKVRSNYDNPPYYAALVRPAMQSTYGGVRTDYLAHVIDTEGAVIPGLYAAGAVSGHACFGNRLGNGLTIASTFGLISGETIIAELAQG